MEADTTYLYNSITLADILQALKCCPPDRQPQTRIDSYLKRNKKSLLQVLVDEGPYWINELYKIAANNDSERLRKRREKQTRHVEHTRMARHEREEASPIDDFMGRISDGDYMRSYEETFAAISNTALKEAVCAVCARRLNVIEAKIITMNLKDLPNRERLQPATLHPNQFLVDGCLLEEAGCTRDGEDIMINICQECKDALKLPAKDPPRLSLANNLWIGPVPWNLDCLTIPELLLIALVFPRVFIVKLFPRDRSRRGLNDNQLQNALRGNVTSFELNSEAIASMINGDLMPQRSAILASVLSVTFIGRGKVLNPAALQLFRVRREMVADVLLWLKRNNKYYANITIDVKRLGELPIDGIPQAVANNIRCEDDSSMVDAELAGYVPDSYVDDNADIEALSASSSDVDASEDGSVVPLQYLGVTDNDLSKITANELMNWGLQNLQHQGDNGRSECGYAIRHGAPVNTFGQPPKGQGPADPDRRNFWEAAFPGLYPYGVGGIESDRPVQVSFTEHVQWSLQYHDRRFRYHNSFIFVAFGIQQRRQALISARIQMKRQDFDTVAQTLSSITQDDLRFAAEEEKQGHEPSNPAIQTLHRHINATSKRVMGSGPARMQLRSRISSAAMYFNQPTVWLTVNPDDLHDPVAQVFAGEEIDMDQFIRTAGPNTVQRSQNIARDPFAAAKFFHFTIMLILEKLLGITSTKTRTHSRVGILGRVKAYFGTVECQGRGTLHLHMLIWLHAVPPPRQLREMLQTADFREKVTAYLKANVRSFLPNLATSELVKATPTDTEIAYSRCPAPNVSDLELKVQLKELEAKVVRAKQIHKCEFGKCLRYDKTGRVSCKRRAPWELCDRDSVDADGTYHTKRTVAFLNSYCPAIAQTIKCNQDIKLLLHGDETKHLGYYITKYMTKAEGRSHNVDSLLAEGLTSHYDEDPTMKDLKQRQRDLIFRAVNVLNREQEVPAPLAVTHMMGWGDYYSSHYYDNIYWGSFVAHIHRTYNNLRTMPVTDQLDQTYTNAEETGVGQIEQENATDDNNQTENVLLEFSSSGKLYRKSQVDDYMYRGEDAAAYNVLDYFVNTYEQTVSRRNAKSTAVEADSEQLRPDDSDRVADRSDPRGRPPHPRILYQDEHPRSKTHIRVVRPTMHNHVPNMIGPRFPRRSDPTQSNVYAASILTFLKPWRGLSDLKKPNQSWDEALDEFLATAEPRVLDIIDNLEHRHEAQAAAEVKQSLSYVSEDIGVDAQGEDFMDTDETEIDHDGPHRINSRDITQEIIDKERHKLENNREVVHGIQAVQIAQNKGLFTTQKAQVRCCSGRATEGELSSLKGWLTHMERDLPSIQPMNNQGRNQPDQTNDIGIVQPLLPEPHVETGLEDNIYTLPVHEKAIQPMLPTELLPQQKRACGILRWHVMRSLYAQDYDRSLQPPQLRMLLVGPGGTGKSKVLQTMTEELRRSRIEHQLIKAAYTGCAASQIEGQTTHTIARIIVGKKDQTLSNKAKKELAKIWQPIEYLFIDEYSMLSKEFLAHLSRNISTGKLGFSLDNGDLPFGGVNVVLCGDTHQIPPVAVVSGGALYYPAKATSHDVPPELRIGRIIYESFEQVVILKQQVRVTDPVWQRFLNDFRRGCIKDSDISMLDSITLTNAKCVPTDFESEKWMNCCLITPRNSVRIRWNDACVMRHCQSTGHQLFTCPAFDTCIDQGLRRPINLYEKYVSIKNAASSRNPKKGRRERNGLPDEVSIAIGLKVMVTLNVNTSIDVTNGARGVIVGIKLDPNEPPFNETDPVITLERLPAYILVKLNRTRAAALPGLEEGVIPIIPASKSYTITLPIVQKDGQINSITRNVRRLQFPITPAYAFTDYRSQGQTISAAIIDIATPPSGELKRPNVYVALSRCSGRDDIRILRDFDREILKKPMEFELKKEDERLESLDRLTERWWNEINQ